MTTLLPFGSAWPGLANRVPAPVDREDRETRLYADMLHALLGDPSIPMATPGCFKPWTPAVEVIAEEFSDHHGTALLVELLGIVAAASKAGDKRATDWLQARAAAYAAWHLQDVLDDEAGES